MARPVKKGLDYFSFDVDFFEDQKIKKLKRHFGAPGVVIYLYIIVQAYKENGYYIIYDEDLKEDLHEGTAINIDDIEKIIKYIIEIDLLRIIKIAPLTVITSKRIQKNYTAGTKERAKKNKVSVNKNIWLLDEKSHIIIE